MSSAVMSSLCTDPETAVKTLDKIIWICQTEGMSKFNSLKDQVVYRATLHGCDDELGDVQGFGWYGLLLGFHGKDYIVHEDSQGFVDVESFSMYRTDADGDTYRSAEAGNVWVDLYDEFMEWESEGEDDL